MNDTIQLIMLFAVLQGILLLVGLASKRHRNLAANQVLMVFVFAICLLLSFVLLSFNASWSRSLGYLGDSVGLVYGPLFYFYVLKLLSQSRQKLWPHLLPFLLFVGVNSLWLLLEIDGVWAQIQNGFYTIMSVGSLFQLMVYLLLSWRLIVRYKAEVKQERSAFLTFQYLRRLILIIFICALMFMINYFSQLLGLTLPFPFLNYSVGWLLLSAMVFVLAIYGIRQPEIFRIAPLPPTQNDATTEKEVSGIVDKLKLCLQENKPFLNPELSLEELARTVDCRKELLSKAINQGLSTNFYRLINEHRIREFEELASNPANAHLTHLALALEAGFRSKTTFYKAFKELKQMTPGAYLKTL